MKRQPLLLFGWLLLGTPAAMQAQFYYTVTNGTVTITEYTGTQSVVVIPKTITGLPVTAIGVSAFYNDTVTSVTIPDGVTSIGDFAFSTCSLMTNVTIPNSLMSIGAFAFNQCLRLTNVTIPNSVTNIGNDAFQQCTLLTSVTIPNRVTSIAEGTFQYSGLTGITIPNSVTSIGYAAFAGCSSLTNVTIPNTITSIGDEAFAACYNLTSLYFQGNAPNVGTNLLFFDNIVTLYYLPGTTAWGSTFASRPTALWSLPYPLILTSSLGVQSNQFAFTVSWATNLSVVVEASSNLANPVWSPVATNGLSGGTCYFSDAKWTNYPSRFYRVRSL